MSDLTLVPINGEPRIQDLQLAERLGFERPRDIRKLIDRNLEKLNQISICATMAQIREGAGRPAKAYYLNEKQSIFICMKADTVNAFEVQMEIIDVYSAYRRGDLVAPTQLSAPAPDTLTVEMTKDEYIVYLEGRLGQSRRVVVPPPVAVTARRARPMTEAEHEQILRLFNQGLSRRRISRAIGRDQRCIDRSLERSTRASAPQMALRLLEEGKS